MQKSVLERLMPKITIDHTTGCWVMQSKNRYPSIKIGRKAIKAHRASWECHAGPIPVGFHVCHRCDNTHCINPHHLFLGTHADNMQDCVSKGRHVIPTCKPEDRAHGDRNGMRTHPGILAGERNGRSKVTNKQRQEIVAMRYSGAKRLVIAEMYQISISQVARIVQQSKKAPQKARDQ